MLGLANALLALNKVKLNVFILLFFKFFYKICYAL